MLFGEGNWGVAGVEEAGRPSVDSVLQHTQFEPLTLSGAANSMLEEAPDQAEGTVLVAEGSVQPHLGRIAAAVGTKMGLPLLQCP